MASAAATDHKHRADTTVAQEDSRPVKKARKRSTVIPYAEFEESVKCLLITIGGMTDDVATLCLDHSLLYPFEMPNPPLRVFDWNGKFRLFYSTTPDALSVWGNANDNASNLRLMGSTSMTNPLEFVYVASTSRSPETMSHHLDYWDKVGPGWKVSWRSSSSDGLGGEMASNTLSITAEGLVDGKAVPFCCTDKVNLQSIHTRDPLHHVLYTSTTTESARTHTFTAVSLIGTDHAPHTVTDSIPYLIGGGDRFIGDRGPLGGRLFEVAPGRFIQPVIDWDTDEYDFYECHIHPTGVFAKTKLKRPVYIEFLQTLHVDLRWMRAGDVLVRPVSDWYVDGDAIINGPPAVVIVWTDAGSWDFEKFTLPIDSDMIGTVIWTDHPHYVVCGNWLVVSFPWRGLAFRFSLDIRVLQQRRAEAKARVTTATIELA